MIESLRKKQVKIQAQREEEILQKIKQKMDRIKANQQKLQPGTSTPKTHYQGKFAIRKCLLNILLTIYLYDRLRYKCEYVRAC